MASIPFSHKSVLLYECIEALDIKDGMTYVDCTTGGGGHSLEIAKRLPEGSRLICLDTDTDALASARERLSDYTDKITFVNDNFINLARVIEELNITNLGGVLADLGCSSFQFDCAERGFSYNNEARLDMRMNKDAPLSAFEVVNEYAEGDLATLIYEYGEERFSRQIARAIVNARQAKPIETTTQLSDIIRGAIPKAKRIDGPHPAKRTFQAIRIEVNRELDSIAPMINAAAASLVSGGRIAVISFHSLEDRIVKTTIRSHTRTCTCPPDFPVCVCGRRPILSDVTRKPILPSDGELNDNPRARSAKLRVAEKI